MFGNPETTPGGQSAEILRLRPRGYPPHRSHQEHRWNRHRQPHQGQGRQKQARPSLHRGRVRHHVQRGHLQCRLPPRSRDGVSKSSRNAAPGSATKAPSSPRAAMPPRKSSKAMPRVYAEIEEAVKAEARRERRARGRHTSGVIRAKFLPRTGRGWRYASRPGLFMSHPSPNQKRPNRFVTLWRTIGGGSLTLSLCIHGALILLGGFLVIVTQLPDEQIDFLPGGGSEQGANASAEMRHQIQQKKRKTLSKTMPMKKLVTTSLNAQITLPDAPLDLLDVPDMSSVLGGGAASGGFGKAGSGGGFGDRYRHRRNQRHHLQAPHHVWHGAQGHPQDRRRHGCLALDDALPAHRRQVSSIAVARRQPTRPLLRLRPDHTTWQEGGGQSPQDRRRRTVCHLLAAYWEGKGDAAGADSRGLRRRLKYDPTHAPMPLEAIYQQMAGASRTPTSSTSTASTTPPPPS
jgi:hypothetical protein